MWILALSRSKGWVSGDFILRFRPELIRPSTTHHPPGTKTDRQVREDRQAGRSPRAPHALTAGWLSTLLIESQEEVRSDLRSRKFAQIRSIIQAGSGNGS
jgi:hypothetical protein